ncbi:MAG: hypothetical protein KZQ92_11100, partial [Candidatus Thiodiazotropha sp. (ex Lucinoma borealis)]|nr:hypothetical protein [Candidatus Thiodiazotropha sp. (ex Lucinoma borealis)]
FIPFHANTCIVSTCARGQWQLLGASYTGGLSVLTHKPIQQLLPDITSSPKMSALYGGNCTISFKKMAHIATNNLRVILS